MGILRMLVEFRPDVLTLYPLDPVGLSPLPQGLSGRITTCFICINKLCKDKKVINMLGNDGWGTEWQQDFTKCLFIDCSSKQGLSQEDTTYLYLGFNIFFKKSYIFLCVVLWVQSSAMNNSTFRQKEEKKKLLLLQFIWWTFQVLKFKIWINLLWHNGLILVTFSFPSELGSQLGQGEELFFLHYSPWT